MRRALLFPLMLLVACDAPGPGFYGISKTEQVVQGSRFTIRVNGRIAEVIRTNPEMFPRYETIAARATIAVQRATGCTAAWVEGDPSVMMAGLACNGETPPAKPPRRRSIPCAIVTNTPFGSC